MSDSSDDKQLPATAKRLKTAREEGQIARSRDLGHFALVAVSLGVLAASARPAIEHLRDLTAAALRFDVVTLKSPERMLERLHDMGLSVLPMVIVFGLVGAVAVLAAAVASGGWVFTTKVLEPKFEKLNPIAGLGNIVSKAQLGDMLKACVLALVLGIVGATYLWSHHEEFVRLQSAGGLVQAFEEAGELMLSGLWLLVLVLALFAAVDVPLQRFLHASRLKMSHQEVKEEFKQQEGNQEVKGRIKARMREVARRRMMAAVPKADLVVMNPTHYAVALKYDPDGPGAPKVVAKGTDALAMRIRDLAAEARVPVLQAPPLARALYATTELEHEIPMALYSAVAQVLAHVYRLREAMAGRAPYPGTLADVPVPPELDPDDPRHSRTAARRGTATP
ncbi:flagellar biosynthesis protein FlhB [Sphaerotilus uruguayifluvii]|uniref:Flagellar biosynthetic protein FlhB n=1 Tax=Sphaerotilus uruguayifluvii TaxID=2735897 RepID=A0ABX2FZ43_9BURK|nr:flagellar biosynthesis protein FlhB [Leptothrix sp. C29]NRT55247.1 flagellar biosynthetic protein FlhB [Leptothrix sp. C29]